MCIHLKNYEIPVSRRTFRNIKHLSNKYGRLLDCIFLVKYEYNSPSKKQKALERVYILYVVKWFVLSNVLI